VKYEHRGILLSICCIRWLAQRREATSIILRAYCNQTLDCAGYITIPT